MNLKRFHKLISVKEKILNGFKDVRERLLLIFKFFTFILTFIHPNKGVMWLSVVCSIKKK